MIKDQSDVRDQDARDRSDVIGTGRDRLDVREESSAYTAANHPFRSDARDQLDVRWEQLKGQVNQKWGQLTSEDFSVIGSKKGQLLAKLRERYGYTVEQAEREIGEFMSEAEAKRIRDDEAERNRKFR